MSNRQFKTLISNSKYILFDYGDLTQLPEVDLQLAGVCRVQGVFYIKQRNSTNWNPLVADQILINVVYNIDDQNDGYWWFYNAQEINSNFEIKDQYKGSAYGDNYPNHLFLWKHNQQKMISCQFFRTINNGQSYRKIDIPYQNIGQNIIIADFTGFTIQESNENQSFYILCN